MAIIKAELYRGGRAIGPATLEPHVERTERDDEFVWVGVADPSEAELRKLAETFDLHPLAIEDALNTHQLPKVEVYGDQLFLIVRTARLEDDHIVYGETSIFVGARHIVSVRHGSLRAHAALRAQLEASPALLRHGVDYVLHGILDFTVDGYLPIVDDIEEEVLEMEQRALDHFLEREEVTRLFGLRRELARFNRMLGPMAEVVSKLANLDLPCVDADIRPYYRDVLDHVRRVESMVAALRDVLASVLEVSNLLEQQRQGAITRQLAAWAAILAVPTAIAGIYGMNFEHMPELRWRFGYPVTIAVIASLCVGLYVRFRRAKWL